MNMVSMVCRAEPIYKIYMLFGQNHEITKGKAPGEITGGNYRGEPGGNNRGSSLASMYQPG